MNIVTESDGVPGAVLLRGAVAIEGIDIIRHLRSRKSTPADKQLLNSPAKLTQGWQSIFHSTIMTYVLTLKI